MEKGEGEPREKDIVWAKIKGYPWWPGIIRTIRSNDINRNTKKLLKKKIFTIDFIGNKSKGEVTKSDINLFTQNYEEHCKTRNPSLLKSIELAKKLYQEKTNTKKTFDIQTSEKKKKTGDIDDLEDFLGKKRKENFTLDEINEEKEDKIKRNNDIKINININVTNNNQRTVNINSFSNISDINDERNQKTKNGKNRNKKVKTDKIKHKKEEDEDYIFEEDEYDDEEQNEEEDKNEDFNYEKIRNELTDNEEYLQERCCKKNTSKSNNNNINNKNEMNNSYSSCSKDRKRKKKRLKRGIVKDEKDISYLSVSEKNENASEMFSEDKEFEDLDKIIKNLVDYQIQIPNIQNQKLIIKELNNLQNTMNNDNNSSENANFIYLHYNEIYKILSTFTYNKNSEIVFKSADILSSLPNKVINDIFILSKEEKEKMLLNKNINNNNDFREKEEELDLELNNICDLINDFNEGKDNKDYISTKSKKNKIKKNDINLYINKDNNKGNFLKDDSFLSLDSNKSKSSKKNISCNTNKNLCDNIIHIILNGLSDDFYDLSEKFFKYIYNKNHIGLDKYLAKKRKFICIKLFSLFKKVFPKLDEEYIKKIIIFFEYKTRKEDPLFGEKYKSKIDELFHKVKNINIQK